MKLYEYIDYLATWLNEVNKEAKTDGYILGLSGGIDSSCVAGLLKKGNINALGVIMPCHSNDEDAHDAILLAEALDFPFITIDLSSTYDELVKKMKEQDEVIKTKDNTLALHNIKVRLRMVTLYALGQARNFLVCGTDNLAEWYTGYFTKFGDGGVDLVPLVHLTKGEVKEAAKYLGVPESIINKTPTAGLYTGQTDEGEMGVTYEELDQYLLGKPIDKVKEAIIERLHKVSEHKRNLAIKPKDYIRD